MSSPFENFADDLTSSKLYAYVSIPGRGQGAREAQSSLDLWDSVDSRPCNLGGACSGGIETPEVQHHHAGKAAVNPNSCPFGGLFSPKMGQNRDPRDGTATPMTPSVQPRSYAPAHNCPLILLDNPVRPALLEEPLERKREYWSTNLVTLLKMFGYLTPDANVRFHPATPEQDFRLSSAVVKLVEQEKLGMTIPTSSFQMRHYSSSAPSHASRLGCSGEVSPRRV